MEQRAGFHPVRNIVMQFGRKSAVDHGAIVSGASKRFDIDCKVDRPLRGGDVKSSSALYFSPSSDGALDPPTIRLTRCARDFPERHTLCRLVEPYTLRTTHRCSVLAPLPVIDEANVGRSPLVSEGNR